MGKRGPAPRLNATSAGYWVEPFPLTRERASEILGQEVPLPAWQEIEKAFRTYQDLRALAATTTGLPERRDKAKKRLEGALQAVLDQFGDPKANGAFKSWASHATLGRELDIDLDIAGSLARAATEISAALRVIKLAAPPNLARPGDAETRRSLARRIFDALKKAGLPVAVSDGRKLLDEATLEGDLTGFERLLWVARIHEAESPAAFAKWARRAIAGKNSPKGRRGSFP
jgi:hypothetical protein